MSFLTRLLLGKGTLPPHVREVLETEGIHRLDEGLGGSVRYSHFKAPGRRFNGKVQPERMGLAISGKRLVVYARSGAAELIDSPFGSPRFEMLDIVVDPGRLILNVDYDRGAVPNVSGKVAIHIKTSDAEAIKAEIEERIAAPGR